MALHLLSSAIDTDVTLAVSSDTKVPSVAAIKAFIAASAGGSIVIDAVPTNGSANAVSSDGVFDALATKQALSTDLTTIAGLTLANDNILQRKTGAWVARTPAQLKVDLALTSTDVGLSNVNNTSDANKPVSSSQQTALNLKANLVSPTFTGTVVLPSTTSVGSITPVEIGYLSGLTSSIQTQFSGKQNTLISGTNIKTVNGASIVGTGDLVVTVTTDATPTSSSGLPVQSGGVFTALGLKSNLASPSFTGTPSAPTATAGTNTLQIATTAFVQSAIPTVNFSTSQYSGTGSSGSPLLISNLAGSVITSGTVADARLSSNIPLKNVANTFTADISGTNLILTGGLISNNDSSSYAMYASTAKLRVGGVAEFGSVIEILGNGGILYMKTAAGVRYAITLNTGGTAFNFTAA